MPRVFVVQEPLKKVAGVVMPRIDYGTLTPYGDVKFLFQWSEGRDDTVMEETAPIIWKLRAALHDYTAQDYLVPLGNPVLIAMAVAVAADCNDGIVTMLDWIRDESRYRTITFDLLCEAQA